MLTDLTHVIASDRPRFAYNVTSVEGFLALVDWGETHGKAMVLQCSERYLKDLGEDFFRQLVVPRLDTSPVPFVLHLDHAGSLEAVLKGLQIGFSSVMFDGSTKPLEENIALSREAAKLARMAGVSFEAEVGHVGGAEDGDEDETAMFTRVGDAKAFTAAVPMDFLAVSVGNAHGRYRKPPKIQLNRIADLAAAVPVPLVLHGGTGIPPADLVEATRRGMVKINLGTELKLAWIAGIQSSLAAGEMELDRIRASARQSITHVIQTMEALLTR